MEEFNKWNTIRKELKKWLTIIFIATIMNHPNAWVKTFLLLDG